MSPSNEICSASERDILTDLIQLQQKVWIVFCCISPDYDDAYFVDDYCGGNHHNNDNRGHKGKFLCSLLKACSYGGNPPVFWDYSVRSTFMEICYPYCQGSSLRVKTINKCIFQTSYAWATHPFSSLERIWSVLVGKFHPAYRASNQFFSEISLSGPVCLLIWIDNKF